MDLALSLVIGIASSLVATMLFIAISEFIRRVASPWYADKIYRGVRIDGKWREIRIGDTETESEKSSFEFNLEQRSDVVSGQMFIVYHNHEPPEIFNVSGLVRDAIFSATLRPSIPHVMDAGTALLRVTYPRKSLQMRGTISYIDQDNLRINASEEIVFERNS